jgi:hypothetical protein
MADRNALGTRVRLRECAGIVRERSEKPTEAYQEPRHKKCPGVSRLRADRSGAKQSNSRYVAERTRTSGLFCGITRQPLCSLLV